MQGMWVIHVVQALCLAQQTCYECYECGAWDVRSM